MNPIEVKIETCKSKTQCKTARIMFSLSNHSDFYVAINLFWQDLQNYYLNQSYQRKKLKKQEEKTQFEVLSVLNLKKFPTG